MSSKIVVDGAVAGSILRMLSKLAPKRPNTFLQYLFVTALMAFALLARLSIAPFDGGIQYITFFPAVAISAVIGGLWPGLFSAAIGLVLATYLFWPPYRMLVFEFDSEMLVSNVVFMIDAVLVCSAIEAMHRYYSRYVATEQKLRLAASVVHNSNEGIMVTDQDSVIVSVNPAFTDITGYTPAEALGQTPRLLRSNRHDVPFFTAMWTRLQTNGFWQGEIWNRRKDGEAYLQWTVINRIDDSKGNTQNYVAVFHDVTELRKDADYIKHLAYHDILTKLPNRMLFYDRLQHAVERAARDGSRLVIAFIDLDRFKEINDKLGHEIGDLLLQEVAKRLQSSLRESDTAARLGGDEFVALFENLHSEDPLDKRAAAMIANISQPMGLRGNTVQIGASIGLVCFPDDGRNISDLMKHADIAMYAAKQAGRNTYRFFDETMIDSSEAVTSR